MNLLTVSARKEFYKEMTGIKLTIYYAKIINWGGD